MTNKLFFLNDIGNIKFWTQEKIFLWKSFPKEIFKLKLKNLKK